MSRSWKAIAWLLGFQSSIAATAAALEWGYSCGACRAGGFSLGLVGFAFYAGLFLAAAFSGPAPLLSAGIIFGFGVHVMLVAQLLLAGLRCWICFGAALVSLALVVAIILHDRANLARMAFVLPWSVLLVLGWNGAPRAASAAPTAPGAVRVTVFTQSECGYCDDLRRKVMPDIEREFGPRIEVVYRPAADLPAIRKTPTLILSPAVRDRQGRVIEGLPSPDSLREAILSLEARP